MPRDCAFVPSPGIAGKIIVFTVHKAASMFLHRVLCDLAGAAGVPYYSPNNDPHSGFCFPVTRINNDMAYTEKFYDKSGCIGPIRRPVLLSDFSEHDIILHLRNPLDGLTSMFFSYAYSHVGVEDHVKQRWVAMGIDQFVFDQADDYFERYRLYCKNFIGRPNVTLITYEEMISDFKSWLEKLAAPFPLINRKSVVATLAATYRNEFTVQSENPGNHKRKVTPGDHKNKLAPETIKHMASKYRDVFAVLGRCSSGEVYGKPVE